MERVAPNAVGSTVGIAGPEPISSGRASLSPVSSRALPFSRRNISSPCTLGGPGAPGLRYGPPKSTGKSCYNSEGDNRLLNLPGTRKSTLPVLLLIALTASSAVAQTPPAPSPAEQQSMLAAIRQYAERYVGNLPNFICEQVTRQFEAGKKPKRWHKGDMLASKLVYEDGREERTLQMVNNRPVGLRGRFLRRPLETEGEFGMLMDRVFGSAGDTDFTWCGWDTRDGRTLAVFHYSIDGQHSTLSLTLGALKAVVPYHGSISADPATGTIWRITSEPSDIPPYLETKSLLTTIDYEPTDIAGQSYILPVRARVTLATPSNHIRNDIEFTNYRKFETESRITYSTSGSESEPGARQK